LIEGRSTQQKETEMIKSQIKFIPLKKLKEIKDNGYRGEHNADYGPYAEEIDFEILRKAQSEAEKQVRAIRREEQLLGMEGRNEEIMQVCDELANAAIEAVKSGDANNMLKLVRIALKAKSFTSQIPMINNLPF